jgi:type II secretory pathway pseudopilin PulG
MNKQNGFSLVELAIVFLIVAILLGGLIPILSTQHDASVAAENQRRLVDARDALYGYALSHGRLPCPASATDGAGTERVSNGQCSQTAGVLPWVTLGVADTDGYGRRLTYRVTPEFARSVPQTVFGGTCTNATIPPNPPSPPLAASFALCSVGNITIVDDHEGRTIATQIPAVVISHGKNGNGGYSQQGTRLANGSDQSEIDNQLTNDGTSTHDTRFVSKPQTETYDDTVVYLSPSLLFQRMIAAGKLP